MGTPDPLSKLVNDYQHPNRAMKEDDPEKFDKKAGEVARVKRSESNTSGEKAERTTSHNSYEGQPHLEKSKRK